jgi:Kef-type K+ transport system membrane component KefB
MNLETVTAHVMHQSLSHDMAVFALQLGIILTAAKFAGELFERYLKQPSVLGELVAGMIIGPYLLGAINFGSFGPLFPIPLNHNETHIPVSIEIWSFGQVAAVVLLFMAGLETNLKSFLRNAFRATVIAIGGVIFPFFFGAFACVWFGYAPSVFSGSALFMGAIMTATSVGITARVLSDIRCLNTDEGVTILGGAVVDDVLGILILAIVVSLSKTGEFNWGDIARKGSWAFGFWLGITALGTFSAGYLARFLRRFRTAGSTLALALAFALIVAAVTELFGGLAMIIGAYVAGLSLSATDLSEILENRLSAVYDVMVPVFFVMMGMLVDFKAMGGALLFGVVISLLWALGCFPVVKWHLSLPVWGWQRV